MCVTMLGFIYRYLFVVVSTQGGFELSFPSAGIKDVYHHAWPYYTNSFFFFLIRTKGGLFIYLYLCGYGRCHGVCAGHRQLVKVCSLVYHVGLGVRTRSLDLVASTLTHPVTCLVLFSYVFPRQGLTSQLWLSWNYVDQAGP